MKVFMSNPLAMDYFSLFSLPTTYAIDHDLLIARYQEQQRKFHPDRFANAPDSERLSALQQATTINAAYQTLKHPLKRAEYLLSLHGINLLNEQQTMRDTTFLMEQLALREELDDIEQRAANVDQDENEVALLLFAERIVKMVARRSTQLTTELANEQWSAAADTVRKLRFLDKLQQQIELIEERWLDA